jgi:hypothetical protein
MDGKMTGKLPNWLGTGNLGRFDLSLLVPQSILGSIARQL